MSISLPRLWKNTRYPGCRLGTILFQETYHRESSSSSIQPGHSRNYASAHRAMDRAMEGGIDDVGLGVLLDLGAIATNSQGSSCAEHLKPSTASAPTISVPRVKHADDIGPDEFDNGIDDDTFIKIIACIRIAVPYTGMIISTRGNQEVRARALHVGISQIAALPAPALAAM